MAAQHAQCDEGAAILRYLATGDNGGDPGMQAELLRLDPRQAHGDDVCASTVLGNPSGEDGADWGGAYAWFNDEGSIDTGEYQDTRENFPGCFP